MCNNAESVLAAVLIPNAVFDLIHRHVRSVTNGCEQGGLLLGYRKSTNIQIEGATFPGLWDHGSSTIFHRSERGHRVRALREWVRSGKIIDWVGEWHTHPGGLARPSFTDRRTWARLAKHTSNPMAFLIFSDTDQYAGLQIPHARFVRSLRVSERSAGMTLFS